MTATEPASEVEWFRRFPTGGTVFRVSVDRLGEHPQRPTGGATVYVVPEEDA